MLSNVNFLWTWMTYHIVYISKILTGFWEVLHNTLHTLHTLINKNSRCVLGDISKYHILNVSKTHWEYQCVLWNILFKYIIVSKTHWHSQCVLETFMYLNLKFPRTQWISQCVFGDISNVHNTLGPLSRNVPKIIHSAPEKSPKTHCAINEQWMTIEKNYWCLKTISMCFGRHFKNLKYQVSITDNTLENIELYLDFILF